MASTSFRDWLAPSLGPPPTFSSSSDIATVVNAAWLNDDASEIERVWSQALTSIMSKGAVYLLSSGLAADPLPVNALSSWSRMDPNFSNNLSSSAIELLKGGGFPPKLITRRLGEPLIMV